MSAMKSAPGIARCGDRDAAISTDETVDAYAPGTAEPFGARPRRQPTAPSAAAIVAAAAFAAAS
ncbi:hypothetical protein BST45_09235 [Mycobacterium shinjukuense]|nr:hypothetical protein BST45_09235 [Mycobacterium shinjukuense]